MDESTVVRSLQSAPPDSLLPQFLSHLSPFSSFTNLSYSNPNLKTYHTLTKITSSSVRPLAKQFLPFLTKCVNTIPNLLKGSLGSSIEVDRAKELLKIHRVVIECFEVISVSLAGSNNFVDLQRGAMINCLDTWGEYMEAEMEGVLLIRKLNFEKKDNLDSEIVILGAKVVAVVVGCSWKRKCMDGDVFQRNLEFANLIFPLLRALNTESAGKYHDLLAASLCRCTLFLVKECFSFDYSLVQQFCEKSLKECLQLSSVDRYQNAAYNLCRSIDKSWKSTPHLICDMLRITLKGLHEKATLVKSAKAFLEIVLNFVRSLSFISSAGANVFKHASDTLYEYGDKLLPVSPSLASILNLYATGLCSKASIDKATDVYSNFINNEKKSKILSDSLGVLEAGVKQNKSSICASEFTGNNSKQLDVIVYMFSYLDALEYVCLLLIENVNKKWERFVSKNNGDSDHEYVQDIRYIQDTFHQFYDLFSAAFRHTNKIDIDYERLLEYRKTMLRVAVSALKISVIGCENLKRPLSVFENIISSAWIEPQELKYFISAVGNVGSALINNRLLKHASLVLELRCKIICSHVKVVCETYYEKKGSTSSGLSEDEVRTVVINAYETCASMADILHKSGSSNVHDVVVKCLIDLSVGDIFPSMSSSLPLAKQWVKMLCNDYKNADIENVPCLYSLLNNFSTLTVKTLSRILEQELLAYYLMKNRNPDLCKKMQSKLIDALLNEVLTSEEYKLQRSRVLVWKGRAVRDNGGEGLYNCIKCMRDAILLLTEISDDSSENSIPICNQLAFTYLLAAQCSQEADADFEVVLKDICSAVKILASINNTGQFAYNGQNDYSAPDTIQLLCNIVDLLAMKGCWEIQFDICKHIFLILENCKIPMDQRLAVFWSERRLNHSLCFSPISEDFLLFMSQHLNDQVNSFEFWNCCFSSNMPSHVAFFQKFLPPGGILPDELCAYSCANFFGNIAASQVESVASSLISDVHLSSQSLSTSGHLYHDLAERLFSGGQSIEALSHARTSLRLRKRMLQRKFSFDIKFTEEVQREGRVENQNQQDTVAVKLEILESEASKLWPNATESASMENSITTPWSALRAYLESILQVGIINESIGNGGEAKALFQTGNKISSMQKLPIFQIVFTSLLGQLYRKELLWDLAEKELNNARNLLYEYDSNISCKRCKLSFEVFIDTQFSDLHREHLEKSNPLQFPSHALDAYKKAVDKLNNDELVSSFDLYGNLNTQLKTLNAGKPVRPVKRLECNVCSLINGHAEHAKQVHSEYKEVKELNPNKGLRKSSRISKQLSKEQCSNSKPKPKNRTNKKTSQNKSPKDNNGVDSNDAGFIVSRQCSDTLSLQNLELIKKSYTGFKCNEECMFNVKCWRCLVIQVVADGNIKRISYLKWEHHRHQLVLQLLLKIANCKENQCGEHTKHEVHDIYGQCASMMLINQPICFKASNVNEACLELIQGDGSTGIFPVEKAALMSNMSWFILKNFQPGDSRIKCCILSDIQISDVASWLLSCFIYSRQLPLLFQKVSRLLACILLISTIDGRALKGFFVESSLSTSQWAAFFHQASLGTYLPCQYLNFLKDKTRPPNDSVDHTALMLDTIINESNLFRFAPERLEQLEEFVKMFYESLSSVPVICISLLEGDYAKLIGEALSPTSVFPAWMLLSRFNIACQPISMLLPVGHIPKQEFPKKSVEWKCPWSYSVVDNVAPVFKQLLEENYSSANIICSDPDKKLFNTNWWLQRKGLDKCLNMFLKAMEDSWLGPWACLMLGERLDTYPLSAIIPKLKNELKHHCQVESSDSLISAVLNGSTSVSEAEACISQLMLYNGYIGFGACCRDETLKASTTVCSKETRTISESVHKLITEAISKFEQPSDRDAVILVLDSDVQMLPWENIPILSNQEVYRMPSVNSILFTLKRCLYNQQGNSIAAGFPRVNPSDAYYLLNPGGDLEKTQTELEQWFRNQNWEGEAGKVPSAKDLILALTKHDLFLYFGHGSGMQYMPENEVRKLDKCGATLLMGCSSGSLNYKGNDFAPQGAPISYIFAGSPAVIGNLWEVTDKDIDRFGKAMLESWLQEEPCCCKALIKEFGSLEIEEVSKTLRKPMNKYGCKKCRMNRIASFISKARGVCKLQSLIGASPVCYGVPTFLVNKLRP